MTTVLKQAAPSVIYAEAAAAAEAAFKAAQPQPMIVGSSKSIIGPGANEIDYDKPVWVVNEGVCGFAWVTIRPARGKLVTWLKSKNKGRKGYYGGWELSSWEFGNVGRSSQSYERAMKAATAAAAVLQSYGISAYANGRLD